MQLLCVPSNKMSHFIKHMQLTPFNSTSCCKLHLGANNLNLSTQLQLQCNNSLHRSGIKGRNLSSLSPTSLPLCSFSRRLISCNHAAGTSEPNGQTLFFCVLSSTSPNGHRKAFCYCFYFFN